MINVNINVPDISKQYRITVDNDNKSLKFNYQNNKSISQAFIFNSSNKEILKIVDEKVKFDSNERKNINLQILKNFNKDDIEEI